MIQTYPMCTSCGVVWEGSVMTPHCNNRGYYLMVGEYQVLWKVTGGCRVWSARGGWVSLPAPLPFDITEDVIKMYLVFR